MILKGFKDFGVYVYIGLFNYSGLDFESSPKTRARPESRVQRQC